MPLTSHIPEMAAPRLASAHRNGIGLAAAAHLLAEVDPYPGMDAGDLIELFWNGCYVASLVLTDKEVGEPVRLRVPESFIVNGPSRLHYRIMQVGRDPALSASASAEVKLDCPGGRPPLLCHDENQHLARAVLPETICRQGVNPGQVKRGVPLTIQPYLNMAEGDAITVRWGDVRMDLPPVTGEGVGRPVHVWVPPSVILEAGEDLRLEVTYCILDRVGNNSRWAPPRMLRIGGSLLTGQAMTPSMHISKS
ncbi:hypothetical protein KVG96_23360 [Pseudomonas sp. COR58]|uniref:Uncharacterized protein n=1 Tax=Pseudomonas ekonensis TaxID=2842353 RepID=A0ABS6PKB0_9PSED|nr:hypothetical protein [Pseudomonas ekonensis]MBV4460903.1 hypothetical protein [Pseudomonas ekonensis]